MVHLHIRYRTKHRHLKFIAKHHNYSIVFDNRLFLLQFQHGPKSISMYNVHCFTTQQDNWCV